MIFTACGHLERVLTIELEKGDDLLKKISEACESEGIKNGFVYGAVGNLEKAAVYTAAPIGVENEMCIRDRYSTVAGGRRMFRFATMMAIQGGNVRVGMEDGLYIKSNGELATSNAQQVEKIRRILESLDYEIATPQEAREMLHLKGKDQVNF